MACLKLQAVTKSYDGITPVIKQIDLDVADGEFIVMVGPSGCGKSTLLRMVAGLERTTSGDIYIDNQRVTHLEPKDRGIAMVFQNYALYPHMSVFDNMAYGLKIRGFGKEQIRQRVDEAARILELQPLLKRKPRELSGGQRQRVAMGRAIVREPAVFLFDEPLSNLDAKLRVQMRLELQQLHRRLKTTSLYVTHDQVEAMTLAQRVIVMNKGVAEQIGTPSEVYQRPATLFVASFIGSPAMNLLAGTVSPDGGAFILSDGPTLPLELPRPQWADRRLTGYPPGAYSAGNFGAGHCDATINAGVVGCRQSGSWSVGGRVLLPAYPMRKCLRWVVHYIYIYRQRRCTFLIQIADYGWNHE